VWAAQSWQICTEPDTIISVLILIYLLGARIYLLVALRRLKNTAAPAIITTNKTSHGSKTLNFGYGIDFTADGCRYSERGIALI